MLFDQAKIYVKGGDGGQGSNAFRREKFVAHGGPAGGNGGRGGHVILKVDPQLNTLVHFKRKVHFKAERGLNGGNKNQQGANGSDLIVSVPPGTVVRQDETDDILADLVEPAQECIIATGGRGGRGNTVFKSSTNQAPHIFEKGLLGQERWLKLELKLIADVGIAGVPNAGKSTLLASVTAAKPKIADYPFTTLQPNLGVVLVGHRDFVMADIPGLIEGAAEGVGLGHQFLRHIERTRLLIHLLDGAADDPLSDFEKINEELHRYNPRLAEKPQIVVLNKHDLPMAHDAWPLVQMMAEEAGYEAYFVSAATQHGVNDLMDLVLRRLDTIPRMPLVEERDIVPVFTLDDDPEAFIVEKGPDGFYVQGSIITDLVAQTHWELSEAVQRAHLKLERLGVLDVLREAGVQVGDTVFLAEVELEWMW